MKLSKREPKHMGEVMSDIAERYDKLTKTKMSKEEEKAKEIFTLMTIGKMTVTEINSLTDVERFLLSKWFIEKGMNESTLPKFKNPPPPPPPKKSKDLLKWKEERKKFKEQTQYLGNRTWKWW